MTVSDFSKLAHHLTLWRLEPDGIPFDTPHSWLLAVRHAGTPAILKIRKSTSDETLTAALLDYYGGDGAVRLIMAYDTAVLMERACGVRSAWAMATQGEDDAAADILADTVARLHAPRTRTPPAGLISLDVWFSSLLQRRTQSEVFARAADIVEALLASARDQTVLHGDLHHNNVVFDAARGWLAIDPKGLWGERSYDVANLLRNPHYHPAIVHDAERMRRHATHYAWRLNLDADRILRFAFAHAALSAAWCMDDGLAPAFSLRAADVAMNLIRGIAPDSH
jgi:streptomycin 6-kinase